MAAFSSFDLGCFECCIKCLGGVPYASLVATILCFSGVALFCGCGHVALAGTVAILEQHFSTNTSDHALLSEVWVSASFYKNMEDATTSEWFFLIVLSFSGRKSSPLIKAIFRYKRSMKDEEVVELVNCLPPMCKTLSLSSALHKLGMLVFLALWR